MILAASDGRFIGERRVMSAETRLERLSWPEIEVAIASGKTTAIIVLASSEQHGPHLPEATDALIGEGLAVRLAQRLGNALVAPVIRPGCSDHHLGFPGTISISAEVLLAIVDSYLVSLRRHGFRHFFVFSSHGGNFPVLAQMANRGLPPDVTVVSDLAAFTGTMLKALRPFGRDDETIPHADASETAEMLALHPDLVNMAHADKGFVGEVGLPELQERGLRAVSVNGVLGDPRGATAEMGEAVLNSLVGFLAAHVRGPNAEEGLG
jgi:creatinine amidohydrolase